MERLHIQTPGRPERKPDFSFTHELVHDCLLSTKVRTFGVSRAAARHALEVHPSDLDRAVSLACSVEFSPPRHSSHRNASRSHGRGHTASQPAHIASSVALVIDLTANELQPAMHPSLADGDCRSAHPTHQCRGSCAHAVQREELPDDCAGNGEVLAPLVQSQPCIMSRA